MKILLYLFVAISLTGSCNNPDSGSSVTEQNSSGTDTNNRAVPPIIGYTVIRSYPHDSNYFTEGLEFYKGQLLESSGGNNDESPYPSEMGIADINKGKVTTKVKLDRNKHFGEGITVFGNTLYMLTWKSKIGFTYDINSFKQTGQFNLPTEQGWGLTHDTASLIMSDGSNSLLFLNPKTFQVKYIVGVLDIQGPVSNINELEYVNGFIYANQWLTPYILKIDPVSGKVVGRIDLSALENEISNKYKDTNGLNGIAYNPQSGTFFVTGKNWPLIYEIKLL
jgi:glutaminyl-peptide cyclotransferase